MDPGHKTWQGGDLLSITQPFKHAAFWNHVKNKKRAISSNTMSEATKVYSMVT